MKHPVQEIADAVGGKVDEIGMLPDGSGFATVSYPLPKDHWLTKDPEGFNVPPMHFRMGMNDPRREEYERKLMEIARYAIRASTMNGKESDFDPDAMARNFITGALGYWTPDALSGDEFANPTPAPEVLSGDEFPNPTPAPEVLK